MGGALDGRRCDPSKRSCERSGSRCHRRWRLWAQPIARMGTRRRSKDLLLSGGQVLFRVALTVKLLQDGRATGGEASVASIPFRKAAFGSRGSPHPAPSHASARSGCDHRCSRHDPSGVATHPRSGAVWSFPRLAVGARRRLWRGSGEQRKARTRQRSGFEIAADGDLETRTVSLTVPFERRRAGAPRVSPRLLFGK